MAPPDGGPAGPPPWNIASMVVVRCDLASAAAGPGTVALHLGRRARREQGAVGVERVQTLELTPFAAKRLQELLVELLRHHDAAA